MTEEGIDGEARLSRGELVPAGQPESLQDWAELLVARAREDGVALSAGSDQATPVTQSFGQTRFRSRWWARS